MKENWARDSNGDFNCITSDSTKVLQFDTKDDLISFKKMHPSSTYIVVQSNAEEGIKAVFGLYEHDVWNGSIITKEYSFNSNPNDDNEMREYYSLKEKQDALKSELDRLDVLINKYEN